MDATLDVLEFGPDSSKRQFYDELFESSSHAVIQQSTYWGDVIAPIAPDTPIYLVAMRGGSAVAGLPLYLFRHELGNILTSVPQAGPLGGVFVRPGEDDATKEGAYQVLVARAVELARRHSCLSLTIITNPFADDYARYVRHLQPDYVLENFAQVIDLQVAVVDGKLMIRDYNRRSPITRNLAKARLAELDVGPTEAADDFRAWYEIHRRRHQQLGLVPLPSELLIGICETLIRRGKAELLVARHRSRVVAGALHVFHRDVCDVFMMSMDPGLEALAPNYALTESAILRYARRGVRWYNWQSSPSRESGVYAFKKRWGSEDHEYRFVTRLLASEQAIRAIGCERLKREYPGHFVIPFMVFHDGFEKRIFRK